MAKTIKCKHCGADIPKSAKRCPSCNKKVNHPIVALLCFLIILIALILIIGILASPSEPSDTNSTTATSSTGNNDSAKAEESQTAHNDNVEAEEDQTVLIDDDVITAEFLGFDNHPELGMFTVNLRVTNKTDRKIWVYLDEASVNDEMMQLVMTGVPLNILPEKKGTDSFIFYFQQISIKDFDAVDSVTFKICVKNEETLADIETTSEITITK